MSDPGSDARGGQTHTLAEGTRDPFDLLAEEFAERCRRGESPSIGEYERRYPEHAGRIREFLPTVALMEGLRRGSGRARAEGTIRPLPERLGEFRVVRELGRGGMGVVYEAVQESLGRHVAVKVIHHVHLDAKRLQRFQREAQAVAQLHHTNIVPIFGVGEHDGLPYYVMQYIRGTGLDLLIEAWRGDGSLRDEDRWRFAARVGVQAAEALEHAHEQGVLHRDVKPANLLVDEHRTTWITDFGLAKLSGRDDLTASGDVIGTLRYLAPEALRGEADGRSDVYSLGLTLYELLTLTPPFGETSQSELLRLVSEGGPTRPRKLQPAIPRDLETIVLKATAREPGHRYASAGELADDLRCFLEDRPIRARRATLAERAWRWSRRNRALAAMAATAAASLVLAAAVGWVGYASTTAALGRESFRRGQAEAATKRAEENEALSLAVFQELFDKLADDDRLLPPPPGLASSRRPPAEPGKERGRIGAGFDGPGGPVGFGGREFGPPPDRGRGEGGFGPGGPGGPPPGGDDGFFGMRHGGGPPVKPVGGGTAEDTALLQSVLTFYDRFAERNKTNPRLEGEAARAYRKVGALYTWLGRDEEAAKAFGHAIAMLEDLTARYPLIPEYRHKLVETFIMVDPWSADRETIPTLEARLRRARDLADALVAESPVDPNYAESQIHAHAKLGVTLQLLDRPDEAEACYRRAIETASALASGPKKPLRARLDLITTREALAALQLERDRGDEARTTLDMVVADLRALEKDRGLKPPDAARIRTLADLYAKLGDEARSAEMTEWAEAIGSRSDRGFAGPRDRKPGFGTGPGRGRMAEDRP